MRRWPWLRGALIVLGVGALVLLGILSAAYVRYSGGGTIGGHRVPFMRPAFEGRHEITALILGLDEKDKLTPKLGQRSDSIMLARIDLEAKAVDGISIPRDSRVAIPGHRGKEKINAAYQIGGVDKTMETVEALTGVRPDYYVVSDVTGFRQLVDLIGGIDLEVEKDMDYDDNWQNLHIHLKKGFQHLDGEHAMEYVRFRKDRLADIMRMQRQQKFMRAVAKQMMTLSNLPRLPQIMEEMRRAVTTNIDTGDLIYLASTLRSATGDNIRMATIPATDFTLNGISYLKPDLKGTRKLVARTFSGVGDVSVEVENGTMRVGLARQVAAHLEDSGYNIVAVRNALERNHTITVLRCPAGQEADANRLVNSLGVGYVETLLPHETEAAKPPTKHSAPATTGAPPDSGKHPVVLILGDDYTPPSSESPSSEAEPLPAAP